MSVYGTGAVVEIPFTGSAFVVDDEGRLLTNRHVARPWEGHEMTDALEPRGLEPVRRRLIGYLPGTSETFELSLLGVSEEADLAVLHSSAMMGRVRPLELSTDPPQLGDEVIVMGYPAGLWAVMARASEPFIDALQTDKSVDMWEAVRRLARAGLVKPLATRGIVGQFSDAVVVYDAQTARGGSGGPVLALDGRVIAVNAAILSEFGGSNLGVPAQKAMPLLELSRGGPLVWPL